MFYRSLSPIIKPPFLEISQLAMFDCQSVVWQGPRRFNETTWGIPKHQPAGSRDPGHSADYPTRWTIPPLWASVFEEGWSKGSVAWPKRIENPGGPKFRANFTLNTHAQVNWNWQAERHVVRKALAQSFVQNSLIKLSLRSIIPSKLPWIIASCSSWLVVQTRQVITTIFPLKTSKC